MRACAADDGYDRHVLSLPRIWIGAARWTWLIPCRARVVSANAGTHARTH